MLTTLLPGLRELRPPLAAGALWLVTVFVIGRALSDRGLRIEAIQPVIDTFSALGSEIDGTWGRGIVIGFAAFLIGGLSHAFLTDAVLAQTVGVSVKGDRAINLVARQNIGALIDALELGRLTKVRVSAVDPVLVAAFERALFSAPLDEFDRIPSADGPLTSDDLGREFVLYEREAKLLATFDWRTQVRSYLEREVPSEVASELPSVATRLIGKEQALFDQYDRLRAEAEFRVGLVPPLTTLSIAMPFVGFPWEAALVPPVAFLTLASLFWGIAYLKYFPNARTAVRVFIGASIGIALSIVGVARLDNPIGDLLGSSAVMLPLAGLTYAIFIQGLKIQRAAGDLLADAIFVRRVQSPLLERLNRAVGVATADEQEQTG